MLIWATHMLWQLRMRPRPTELTRMPDNHGTTTTMGHGGVHESPWIMLAPLVILAALSFVGGWVGVPQFMRGHNEIEHFLSPVMQSGPAVAGEAVSDKDATTSHAGRPLRKILVKNGSLPAHQS